MTMKKMDEDKDGKVSFADFEVDIITMLLLAPSGALVVIMG